MFMHYDYFFQGSSDDLIADIFFSYLFGYQLLNISKPYSLHTHTHAQQLIIYHSRSVLYLLHLVIRSCGVHISLIAIKFETFLIEKLVFHGFFSFFVQTRKVVLCVNVQLKANTCKTDKEVQRQVSDMHKGLVSVFSFSFFCFSPANQSVTFFILYIGFVGLHFLVFDYY